MTPTDVDEAYFALVDTLFENGIVDYKSRNGNTRVIFGAHVKLDLRDMKLPILTSKHVAWRTCLRELLWFVQGCTDNSVLQDQGVHIWDINANRAHLDQCGLHHYEEGDLGPIYGHQWRHFNAKYIDSKTCYDGQGVDQVQRLVDGLRDPHTRFSRRHILTAWNPVQMDEMALPPCHLMSQFHVCPQTQRLSCMIFQRSGDVGLGVPFNWLSYAFLTHWLAHHCGLTAGADSLHWVCGNTHIYEEHMEAIREQRAREPIGEGAKPTLKWATTAPKPRLEDYTVDDFLVEDYRHHGKVVMTVK